MKSKWIKVVCLGLAASMVLPFVAACGNNSLDNEERPLRLSSGEFDGVFNPFFATSAYDSTVVGQTQISMLGSDAEGENVTYGEDEPVVTLDYSEIMYDVNGAVTTNGNRADVTVYQMVLKNDILFSDGQPLTAHDVLFNLYVYLDPNYTGSSTLYSTDIQGLSAYLAQDPGATEDSLSSFNATFDNLAYLRARAITLYTSGTATEGQINTAINTYNTVRDGLFADYVGENGETISAEPYSIGTQDDYDEVLAQEGYTSSSNTIFGDLANIRKQFEEDLTTIYNAVDMATYTGTDSQYSPDSFDEDEIWQGFFYEIGLLPRETVQELPVVIYAQDEEGRFIIDWDASGIDRNSNYTREQAIQYAIDSFGSTNALLGELLNSSNFNTGATMQQNFAAGDKEVYFGAIQEISGGLAVPNVSGIQILDASEFNGNTTYTAGQYEMLQITINGVDPRAKWNFAFTVAPMHYYSTAELTQAAMADEDYESNFGVEYASSTFMNVIRSRNGVPVGAGVYQASTVHDDTFVWETDASGNQTQASINSYETIDDGFNSDGIVYLIRNDNFVTTGGNEDEVYNAKIKKLRYVVSSSATTMTNLVTGVVDIADPTANEENVNEVDRQEDLESITVQNAGYGYIGFNASFIPNINVRRALMTVMDITLVQDYYPGNLSTPLYRTFSLTSWVYNANDNYNLERWNPEAYYEFDATGASARRYLEAGGCTMRNGTWYDENGDALEFTFTIAGETTNHPANLVFLRAIEILDSIGIQATLVTDARALYKLASGGLAIWAAAWSSSVDPDMYQVYHSESRATSVLNWGYDYLFRQNNATNEEWNIINELDDLIEAGRETIIQAERAQIYREASDLVMDLAVELPIYQRSDMYVYNETVVDAATLNPEPTPYMNPITEIWKVSYIGND